MIYAPNGAQSSDPLAERFHAARETPVVCRVRRDAPFMHGFGRELKAGEEVLVEGMVGIPHACGFGVRIKGELGFYDWTAFEPVEGGASI